MEKMRLNIRFHNPNSEAATRKAVSELMSDVCIKKIQKKICSSPSSESQQIKEQVHTVSLPA